MHNYFSVYKMLMWTGTNKVWHATKGEIRVGYSNSEKWFQDSGLVCSGQTIERQFTSHSRNLNDGRSRLWLLIITGKKISQPFQLFRLFSPSYIYHCSLFLYLIVQSGNTAAPQFNCVLLLCCIISHLTAKKEISLFSSFGALEANICE